MFYLFAIGSMVGYALQSTLLVHHARKIDGLSLAFYRNVAFIVTLSPLLLWSTPAETVAVLENWRLLAVAGVSGGLSLWTMYGSLRFIGVSFTTAVSIAVATLTTSALGWVLFHEQLSLTSMALIAMIIAGVLIFGLHYRHFPHLDSKLLAGVTLAATGGFLNSITKFIVSALSREMNPFVSGYFWEGSIGLACVVLVLLRHLMQRQPLQRVSRKEFLTIVLCSLPTLLGTGFFCLAVQSGPIAIVGAVGSGGLVIVSLMAWAWYGERITLKQWAGIGLIVAGVVGLRFSA
jgi:drug/metabolite transporter (DMT)-like permease